MNPRTCFAGDGKEARGLLFSGSKKRGDFDDEGKDDGSRKPLTPSTKRRLSAQKGVKRDAWEKEKKGDKSLSPKEECERTFSDLLVKKKKEDDQRGRNAI